MNDILNRALSRAHRSGAWDQDDYDAVNKLIEKSKWIKCSDRLPESSDIVIGWSIRSGCAIVFYDDEAGYWYAQRDLKAEPITHWMPLPEFPNE